MRILLTNDDGIEAPGLIALYQGLQELGEVQVVAPRTCRSGTSHSITYMEPLSFESVTVEPFFTGYGVHGSPADCVKLASRVLFEEPFDLIVAGINDGANVGINMYYSGTVAAAIEAAFLGIPAVALSVESDEQLDFEQAAAQAINALKTLLPLRPLDVININIPAQPRRSPKGLRVVPQATEGFTEFYQEQPRKVGPPHYQLCAGPFQARADDTDAVQLAAGYITLTPIKVDLTHHESLDDLHARVTGSKD